MKNIAQITSPLSRSHGLKFLKAISFIFITAALIVSGFLAPSLALAATSGPNNAGTGANVNGPGTVSWSNPGYITVDDTNYATSVLGNSATSEYLRGTNYGFAIPSGATINGITVSIMRQSSSNTSGDSVDDVDLRLLKAGVIGGTDKAVTTDWPTSMTAASYGGVADMWGTTWTPEEINAANFGVSLSVLNESGSSGRTASVDYIQVTVTYTLAVDTTPDDFSFEDQIDVALSTVIESDEIEVIGIDSPANISVVGGDYSLDGGVTYTSSPGTVSNGNTVKVRQTSSGLYTTAVNTDLTIGGVSDTFTNTTLPHPTPPDPDTTTSGPNDAGTGANVDGPGSVNWLNPGYITADDTDYATSNLGNSATSEYLQGTNYGFAIPSGATINGITVSIMRQSSSNGGGRSVDDVDLELLKAGAIVGTDKAVTTDWPTSMTERSYGGIADLWGTTWTPEEINAIDFGVSLSVLNESGVSSRTASVDYIQVTVTYTLAVDTTPDAFEFEDQIGVDRDTTIESNPITVTNIDSPAAISVVGGEYSINGDPYTADPGEVENDDEVTVQHTSSGSFSTPVNTTLTIDTEDDIFTSTTLAEEEVDTTPNDFSFDDQTGVNRSILITSDPITVTGINSPTDISIVGGEYSINGDPYTADPDTVNNGDTVTVQHTSSASYNTTVDTTLTIGDGELSESDTFSSRTKSGGGGGSSGSRSRAVATTTPAQGGGSAMFNFANDFGIGASGNDVTELQKILIKAGFLNIPAPTGYFGLLTEAAVVQYQAARGITPTSGYVGPKTRAILNAGTTSVMSDEQKTLLIKSLQTQLEALMKQLEDLKSGQ